MREKTLSSIFTYVMDVCNLILSGFGEKLYERIYVARGGRGDDKLEVPHLQFADKTILFFASI